MTAEILAAASATRLSRLALSTVAPITAEAHLGYLLGELRGSVDDVAAIRPDLVGLALSS